MRTLRAELAMACLVLHCLAAVPASAQAAVRYFQTGAVYEYRTRLLELALAKTAATDGKTDAVPIEGNVTQSRGLAMLQEGSVDIASVPTTREREESFLAIRIDILRGLLGYRVFLIRAERQADFLAVRTVDDLRRGFKAGFGEQWADISILRENGLPVVGVADTTTLADMLARGRFDYYPRGVNEAWVELEGLKGRYPDLAVESGLVLYYPCPVYFFVARGNARLADRITRGLRLALGDGSFKALFLRFNKDLVEKAGLQDRRLIRLANPALPPDTPPVDSSWWLPPGLRDLSPLPRATR